MKLRHILLPCAALLAGTSLIASRLMPPQPAADNAVTISPAGQPSPTTCFVMVTPNDPDAVPGVTQWKIFVPRQNANPLRHVDLPLRAQEIRLDQAWRIAMIDSQGKVYESGEDKTPVIGPERDILAPLYKRLEEGCPGIGAGPSG